MKWGREAEPRRLRNEELCVRSKTGNSLVREMGVCLFPRPACAPGPVLRCGPRAQLRACILCPLVRTWDVGRPRGWKDPSWQHGERLGCREQGFGVELGCGVPNHPIFPSVCAAPFCSRGHRLNGAGNAGTAGLGGAAAQAN